MPAPSKVIEAESGPFIGRGLNIPSLDQEKTWDVTLHVKAGDVLAPGALYASCPETPLIVHRCLVPAGVSGRVTKVAPAGAYRVSDTLVELTDDHGQIHPWPWPSAGPSAPPPHRPAAAHRPASGHRAADHRHPFPHRKGAAAIPGPFGAGKTMTQHQLAKWSDADIIVYLGCGERGNEMTQALEEFSELLDPKSQQPLMNRTILIANTSNMPVAAREASVYTGMTIAEYYRDMGYHVALMADSTSRWAEALREISGRLEEMPAEEGFPAYLASRLAEFYERAGYVKTLEGKGGERHCDRPSPPGRRLLRAGHPEYQALCAHLLGPGPRPGLCPPLPSINWLTSYSEYADDLRPWYDEHAGPEFVTCRHQMAHLLQKESELMEIVKLIGADILPEDQKLIIETAKLFRVGFLQQNAYHAIDTYVPLDKQLRMMELMLKLYHGAKDIVSRAIPCPNSRRPASSSLWPR